jgi:hypothetical protein
LYQEAKEKEVANIFKKSKDLTINSILNIEQLVEYVGYDLVAKIS